MPDEEYTNRRQFMGAMAGISGITFGVTHRVAGESTFAETTSQQQLAATPESIDLLIAPSTAELDSVSEIDETATPLSDLGESTVAIDDVVVFKLQITGADGEIQTIQDLTDGEGTELVVEQTESGESSEPYQWDLEAAADLLTGGQDDEYYVVVDTFEVDGTPPHDNEGIPVGQDDEFQATLRSGSENDSDGVSSTFRVVKRCVFFAHLNSNNRLILPHKNEVSVTGTTTLAPGSQFTLEISNASTTPSNFIRTVDVTVAEDRMWESAEFDLKNPDVGSSVSPGTSFTARASEGGSSLVALSQSTTTTQAGGAAIEGEVRQFEASVTLNEQTVEDVVIVADVTLSVGGFVAIQNADDQVIAASDFLSPGQHESVRIPVDEDSSLSEELTAIAYADTSWNNQFDADTDRPYEVDGTTVSDTATVTIRSTEPTATETATGTPTQTETAFPTQTPTETVSATTESPTEQTRTATQGEPSEPTTASRSDLTKQGMDEEDPNKVAGNTDDSGGIPVLNRFVGSDESVGLGVVALLGSAGGYVGYRQLTNNDPAKRAEDKQDD